MHNQTVFPANNTRYVKSISALLRECPHDLLNDMAALKKILLDVAILNKATPYGETQAAYIPHGLTVVLFLAESHMMLTTWPEYGTVVVDMAFCGPIDPNKTLYDLQYALRAKYVEDVFATERRLF